MSVTPTLAAMLADPLLQYRYVRHIDNLIALAGKEIEPRPGVRPGHIPGSVNVPYTELFGADGTLKSRPELLETFRRLGVETTRPSVTSCGSGITAAIGMLALAATGKEDVSLYDGSWSEWGARAEAPVVTE